MGTLGVAEVDFTRLGEFVGGGVELCEHVRVVWQVQERPQGLEVALAAGAPLGAGCGPSALVVLHTASPSAYEAFGRPHDLF